MDTSDKMLAGFVVVVLLLAGVGITVGIRYERQWERACGKAGGYLVTIDSHFACVKVSESLSITIPE